ncbi:hypothetical protein QKC54_gp0565 [Megavirus baoshan]|uniref:Uncharacterized protein n=1 Tax=Megavirus baoshan TaxID=2496520 RepID=A0A3Q8U7Q8_9VIRU|nr:hypothetical protein QKC54_gp0565 [Megavirus baoshan]AZL89267.1 hypothetical protein Mb0507 [Megavirus baoshan]
MSFDWGVTHIPSGVNSTHIHLDIHHHYAPSTPSCQYSLADALQNGSGCGFYKPGYRGRESVHLPLRETVITVSNPVYPKPTPIPATVIPAYLVLQSTVASTGWPTSRW